MLLLDEQKSLIEKIVRANKNFRGNEDLLEDFCAEALQKCYMVFNSTSNVQKIESYVTKVVHTSILSVLKNSGRVRRTNEGYVATKEIKEVPSRLFLDIFYLRYVKGHKQAEIAELLNLSQSEVSKRLMQLSKLISNFFDNSKK